MGNFCSSCGAATGGAKFCPACGSPQTTGAAPGAQTYPQQPAAAYAPAKRGSPILKIVLITVAVLLLLGVIGVVRAFFYVREKVHQEVAEVREGGSRLRDTISGVAKAQPTQAGCELLGKDRVAGMLRSPVSRAEGNEAGDAREYCNYWSEKRAGDEDPERAYRTQRGPPDVSDLDTLIKGITASTSAKGPLLSVNVFRGNGKIAIYGVKTAALFAGHTAEKLEGPWDEAYFGPFDAVMAVRKGDNAILLDLTKLTEKREKGLELAQAMAQAL
jgi:hypothetical protein